MARMIFIPMDFAKDILEDLRDYRQHYIDVMGESPTTLHAHVVDFEIMIARHEAMMSARDESKGGE